MKAQVNCISLSKNFREHGTPDYNTAREAFGLHRIKNVDDFMATGTATPREIVERMEIIHMDNICHERDKKCPTISVGQVSADNEEESEGIKEERDPQCLENCRREEAWSHIDVWTGGILETSDRPGPLFRAVIKDQFTRIRDSDRFWFENEKWKIP